MACDVLASTWTARDAILPSIWLRKESSSMIVTLATLHTCLVTSATCLMGNIAMSAVHSANCALHYAMNNPIGDTICCGPGDTECEQDSAQALVNMKLGALVDAIVGLPRNCPPYVLDVTVSCKTTPTTYWELLQKEACVRIPSVGDDIFLWMSCHGQKFRRTKFANL